ncbi:fimbria/pilus outer membrane usher protein [Enterobacter cloacae]|uniref:fimbria/pilus outer membrane usher protein n=1 Tax=Enterobacter cloacae TaxID=550 RepID=UPI0034A25444
MGTALKVHAGDTFEFNTDVLDVHDRENIDLSQFSHAGYIMPGGYHMVVHVNDSELPERAITFLAPENDPKGSVACLSPELVSQLGLKSSAAKNVSWWHGGKCLALSSLPGSTSRGDLGSGTLYISIPQALMEYSSPNWDPPSRWDNGIAGVLLDYNLDATLTHQQHIDDEKDISGNGTAGANLGAWRLRGDWQMQYHEESNNSRHELAWSRVYLYRPLPSLQSKLTAGEITMNSSVFDSFRFMGAALASDDRMLPPNLRGYAPEVTGVAKTNAKVVISQQGRVIYQTQVAPGAFRIQDLNDTVSGTLDVRVEEQDGSVRTFQVNTARVPYLSRPGYVRYLLTAGQPSITGHTREGPVFSSGEFSWGINNGWSLYGGALLGGDYNVVSSGVGRDLFWLGAMSLDVSQSQASLPGRGKYTGGSYRLSYSKRFEQYDSEITFAGYRFSQRHFMTMPGYLEARYEGHVPQGSRELYTITLDKNFSSLGLTANVNYSHQTYWNANANNQWNISLSKYLDIGSFKNISVSLSAYRSYDDMTHDDGFYLSATVPMPNGANASFNANNSGQSVGWYDRFNDSNTYSLSAGKSKGTVTGSGYVVHDGDKAQVTGSASYAQNQYSSAAMSIQGGFTATGHGAALHRSNIPGGARLMLDTDGASGIPIMVGSGIEHSNGFGKAVTADVNSYYRNSVSIDVADLADNEEALHPVVEDTLTEGAIGYRHFDVITGRKLMAIIRLADGTTPPFGASVRNGERETGIVDDGGSVWLSGVVEKGKMDVVWNGHPQCSIVFPAILPANTLGAAELLLPCQKIN